MRSTSPVFEGNEQWRTHKRLFSDACDYIYSSKNPNTVINVRSVFELRRSYAHPIVYKTPKKLLQNLTEKIYSTLKQTGTFSKTHKRKKQVKRKSQYISSHEAPKPARKPTDLAKHQRAEKNYAKQLREAQRVKLMRLAQFSNKKPDGWDYITGIYKLCDYLSARNQLVRESLKRGFRRVTDKFKKCKSPRNNN